MANTKREGGPGEYHFVRLTPEAEVLFQKALSDMRAQTGVPIPKAAFLSALISEALAARVAQGRIKS